MKKIGRGSEAPKKEKNAAGGRSHTGSTTRWLIASDWHLIAAYRITR